MKTTIIDRVRKINLKRSFILLAVVSVLFAIGAGLLNQTFGDRIAQAREEQAQQWEQFLEDRQAALEENAATAPSWYSWGHGRWGNCGWPNGSGALWGLDVRDGLDLTAGETVLVGLCWGIGGLLGLAYWLLCMAWACQKAEKLGTKTGLWVLLTLLFNLFAIAALYLWSFVRGTCPTCGKAYGKDESYCSRCGTARQVTCQHCNTVISASAAYCPKCGQAIHPNGK